MLFILMSNAYLAPQTVERAYIYYSYFYLFVIYDANISIERRVKLTY